MTLKMSSKHPQILWLFLFLCDLSEKQNKNFLVFHRDSGCLEGGGYHPPPTTYILDPTTNSVKSFQSNPKISVPHSVHVWWVQPSQYDIGETYLKLI